MLTAHHISKAYGIETVLHNISFSINRGERVGLIGPNGAGKSSLMRILAGVEAADVGAVTLNGTDIEIGYLSQGFELDPTLTINETLAQHIGDPAALEEQLTSLGEGLATRPDDPTLQSGYDETLAQLMRLDTAEAEKLLGAFQLDQIPEDQPIGSFSGGQKVRLSLALLLLSKPDLLLLDEPTNHLDIDMLEWLEAWLANFSGAALIVSHDRTFLDRVTNRIIDIDYEKKTAREYSGNYTDYLEHKQLELDKQTEAWKAQEVEIRRMKQDIARTKAQAKGVELSTKPNQPNIRRLAKKVAKKAASREKKLERFLDSEERVEKPKPSWQVKIEFEQQHLGQQVLELNELAVGYSRDRPLLVDITEEVKLGQRVVLTGPNGTGKSTLLKTIAGQLPPLQGSFKLGGSIKLGYMSQEQELIDPQKSALEHIQGLVPMNETEARSYLHYYLFKDDAPLRPAAELSFGERARLTLAGLVATGCNFLLLDEPINHLDIPSRTLFEAALKNFSGTVLAVVHDRYFIRSFATELWWAVPGTGREAGGIEVELLS